MTQKLSDAVSSGVMISTLRSVASSLNITVFNNATVAALDISSPMVVYPPSFSPTATPTFASRLENSILFNEGAVAGLVVAGVVVFGILMGVVYWYVLKRMTPKPKTVASAKLPIHSHNIYPRTAGGSKEVDVENGRLKTFIRTPSPADCQVSEFDDKVPIALQNITLQMRNSPFLDVRASPKARLEAREKIYYLNPHARSSPSLGSSGSSTPSLPASPPNSACGSPQFGRSSNDTNNRKPQPKHRLDDHWIIARYADEVTL